MNVQGKDLHDSDLSLQSGDINGCKTNGKQLLSLWNYTFQWSIDSCLRREQKGGLHCEAGEAWGFFQGLLNTLCHAKSARDVMEQAKAFQSFPLIHGLCSKFCNVDPLGYWSGWSTKRGRRVLRTISQPVAHASSLHPQQLRSLHDWKCFLSLPTKEIKEIPSCLYLFCHHRGHQISLGNAKTGQCNAILLLKLKDASGQPSNVHSLSEPVCSNSVSIKHRNTCNTASQSSLCTRSQLLCGRSPRH